MVENLPEPLDTVVNCHRCHKPIVGMKHRYIHTRQPERIFRVVCDKCFRRDNFRTRTWVLKLSPRYKLADLRDRTEPALALFYWCMFRRSVIVLDPFQLDKLSQGKVVETVSHEFMHWWLQMYLGEIPCQQWDIICERPYFVKNGRRITLTALLDDIIATSNLSS